jgi:hypothetical protein
MRIAKVGFRLRPDWQRDLLGCSQRRSIDIALGGITKAEMGDNLRRYKGEPEAVLRLILRTKYPFCPGNRRMAATVVSPSTRVKLRFAGSR